MVAFEVLLNSKRIYTMGIGDFGTMGIGDFGVMTAHATYHRVRTQRGPIEEGVAVFGTGHNSTDPETKRGVVWDWVEAKVGDEITIRVIETDTCDPGHPIEAASDPE
jgi:hypothetical protein